MTDAGSDSRSHIRLSDSEREDAVARLQANAAEGRLSPAELAERSAAVRAAVTRADLEPAFSDLPAAGGAQAGSSGPVAPAVYPAMKPSTAEQPRPAQRGSSGVLIVSIAPFVALVLFFVTAHFVGYDYAWLWFLLVPLAGILVYGTGARDRYRD